MADYKSPSLSTTPSFDKVELGKATAPAPRAKQNYPKAIILGLICGIVIGGAIGTGVAYAIKHSRSS
jgi:hypothetical protein